MKLTDVIRRPLITEKTSILREDGRTIVFEVAPSANKIEIKRAVEQLLGSKVASIRTSIAHGKVKRQGGSPAAVGLEEGLRQLREGQKMPEFLEGRVNMPIRKCNPTSPARGSRRSRPSTRSRRTSRTSR
jgi:large subunit ribosomal protein L23